MVTMSLIENFNQTRLNINEYLSQSEPLKIILLSSLATASCYYIYDILHRDEPTKKRFVRWIFNSVHKLPPVKRRIDEKINKTIEEIVKTYKAQDGKNLNYMKTLPNNSKTINEVLQLSDEYLELVATKWREGYVSGTVYNSDEALEDLMTKMYRKFMWTNPLHPDTFLDIRKMEAEVVRICCNLFNGDPELSCGTTTSGGTESIMLAMKAYRDRAYDLGIRYPEMVIPVTAHAAFDKAAQYFRIKVRHIGIDGVSGKVNIRDMRAAINSSTCVLVGSAPEFPHGIIDPIEEIAKMGERYKIPVHVDCCLGGFLLPFMSEAGYPLSHRFDFSLPGVTSISCDTHKYGFTPKGSSVIMYRDNSYRMYQFFVSPDWPGGVYASPTFAGSRPGVNIATCWAALMYYGREGYIKSTKDIVTTTRYIKKGIEKVPSLQVIGQPEVSVISMRSTQLNIYELLDAMRHEGWSLNPLQYPYSIHLAVTRIHTGVGVADRFLADLRKCVDQLMVHCLSTGQGDGDEQHGSAAIYGMSQSLPDRSLVEEAARGFLTATYTTN